MGRFDRRRSKKMRRRRARAKKKIGEARRRIQKWLEAKVFDELNADHFAGRLKKPYIEIFQTPGTTTAATSDDGEVVFIAPRVMDQEPCWATDTLLHEMIHIALIEENGDGDSAHGERFTTHANRIGPKVGFQKVKPISAQARSWPQSVRPSTYPAWRGKDCPIAWSRASPDDGDLVVYEEDIIPRSGVPADDEELVVYDDDV